MRSTKAIATAGILLVLALAGACGYAVSKTKWFHGETKRAEASAKTTEELLSAQTAQGSAAAAYVTSMGDVVGTLPESREKDFLGRAGGIALSYLPKPDPAKIIEAQNLKIAVLSGQLELANRLTGDALHRAEVADQRTVRAIAGKRASDIALQEAAAEARGAEQAQFWMMLLAGSVAVLWAYTKLTHLSPGKLSTIVADLRNGTGEQNQAIQIIDSATTPLQQMMTKTNVKLDAFIRKVFS